MNDDYLWDKSGESDPEIQELEDVLSTLRYQPRPLHVPKTTGLGQYRLFTKGLAIAATIALVVLGIGIWFGLNRQPTKVENAAAKDPVNNASPSPKQEVVVEKPPQPVQQLKEVNRSRDVLARNNSGTRRATTRRTGLTASERREAEIAKQQLLTALRVASSKLNLAQRRAQGAPPIIRNQHKVG